MKDKRHGFFQGEAMKKFVEYDVREIGEDGDEVDVQHFDTEKEARAAVARLTADDSVLAVVLERHEGYETSEEGILHGIYETLMTAGCDVALVAGGWIDGNTE